MKAAYRRALNQHIESKIDKMYRAETLYKKRTKSKLNKKRTKIALFFFSVSIAFLFISAISTFINGIYYALAFSPIMLYLSWRLLFALHLIYIGKRLRSSISNKFNPRETGLIIGISYGLFNGVLLFFELFYSNLLTFKELIPCIFLFFTGIFALLGGLVSDKIPDLYDILIKKRTD